MSRELPIIMCSEMVKAILEGGKTQTRRLIPGILPAYLLAKKPESYGPYEFAFVDMADPVGTYPIYAKARYQVGDELWVKETHARWSNDHNSIIYSDDPEYPSLGKQNVALNKLRASSKTAELMEPVGFWQKVSSYFMFEKHVRLWLRVTAVKEPHRIQTISEEDAIEEGFKISGKDGRSQGYPWTEIFRAVWDNLHAKPGERWEDNCWVMGYEFQLIQGPQYVFETSKP